MSHTPHRIYDYKNKENKRRREFGKYLEEFMKYTKLSYFYNSLESIITLVFKSTALIVGGIEMISGNLTLGEFLIISSYFGMLIQSIKFFFSFGQVYQDAKNSFDLLEDIENVLGIHTYPVNWPIGSGKEFKGVYDRNSKKILAFTANNGQKEVEKKELTLDDPALEDTIGYYHKQDLFDEIELLDGAGDEFDLEAVRNGQLTPVFFGSALTNFGVEPFLELFCLVAG